MACKKNASTVDHFEVRSSHPHVVVGNRQARKDRVEQSFTLRAEAVSSLVRVQAYNQAGADASCNDISVCVPPLIVRVLPQIRLPAEDTDAGILARLLLAESISPAMAQRYGDGEDVFTAMRLMRIVLENRIHASRKNRDLHSYIACNPDTPTFAGIIFANRCGASSIVQFHGFSGRAISPDKSREINKIVDDANEGSNALFSLYRKHVEKAIEIAEGPDISSGSLGPSSPLFWRTAGRARPSDYAVLTQTIAGQDFYGLTSGYLANPNRPGHRP